MFHPICYQPQRAPIYQPQNQSPTALDATDSLDITILLLGKAPWPHLGKPRHRRQPAELRQHPSRPLRIDFRIGIKGVLSATLVEAFLRVVFDRYLFTVGRFRRHRHEPLSQSFRYEGHRRLPELAGPFPVA